MYGSTSNRSSTEVNIGTGKIVSDPSLNVDNAMEIGNREMQSYEQGWPLSFYNTLHKSVRTMASPRTHIKVGDILVDVYR